MLVSGIERGLARAAQLAGCRAETQEELVVHSVSEIALSMVAAGRGDELLRVYAGSIAKQVEPAGSDRKTPLERAFNRLPGLSRVTDKSQEAIDEPTNVSETEYCETRPTDYESGARPSAAGTPAFGPEQRALLDGLTGAPIPRGADDARDAPPAAAPGSAPGHPYPPSGLPPHMYPVDAKNFEKNAIGEACDASQDRRET